MTVFSAEHVTRIAAAVIVAALWSGNAAMAQAQVQAQVEAPVTLAPPSSLEPVADKAAPRELGPGSADPAPSAREEQPDAAAEGTDGISSNVLDELDPGSVGVLDPASGGFGIDMWRGTDRALVERLLARLQPPPQSAAVHGLFRRLLLSTALVPSGPGVKDGPSLLALRVDSLLAQGDVVAAQKLLQVAPSRTEDADIARAQVEVAFLNYDNAGACAEVRNRLDQYFAPFWRKSQVFCQLLGGDAGGATIGAGLLQEQGIDDPAFFALVRMLAGEKGVTANGLDNPSALHLAMMRAARVQIPSAVIAEGPPKVLRAVAISPNAELETRLEAAERAEARGAMTADELRQLYLSVNFAPEELGNALSAAGEMSPVKGRALLYRAVRNQTVPAAQAEIIARALVLARAHGRPMTAARVFLPVLKGITPRDDLAWFAPRAAAALYVTGALEAADKWYALARANPETVRGEEDGAGKNMPADVALWPLAAVAALPRSVPEMGPAETGMVQEGGAAPAAQGPTGPLRVMAAPLSAPDRAGDGFDEAMFKRWWKAMAAAGDQVRLTRASRLLAVLEALGAEVDGDAWSRVVMAPAETKALPAVGVTAILRRAAAQGRTGETVLLGLTALGTEAPAEADPRRIAPVVRSLADVGLADDARALSIEAVYGGGI